MWDNKRKAIWLAVALIVATFFAYQNALDDKDVFDPRYFGLLEVIFVTVVVAMFYFYSRQKNQ
jgi:hypothetical protein